MKRNLFAAALALTALAVCAPVTAQVQTNGAKLVLSTNQNPYSGLYTITYHVSCLMLSSSSYWNQSRLLLDGPGISYDSGPTQNHQSYWGTGDWVGPNSWPISGRQSGSYICSAYTLGYTGSYPNTTTWNLFTGNKFLDLP